jgi:hypothetical protein
VGDGTSTEITPELIDGSFVPKVREDVANVEVDGETVVARLAEGSPQLRTHWLNAIGSIVWQCFDGSGTLDEIVADLADGFAADIEVVREDVTALARRAGQLGLLAGVREEVPQPVDPGGVPAGLPLPFDARDEQGAPFSSTALHGRGALLVHWSSSCGYCTQLLGELTVLAPVLARRGIDLVLLERGDVEETRALLDGAGLECRLLFLDEAAELFDGLGTPVAYLVDDEGTVVAPLALGAIQVSALAHRAGDTGRG